MAADCNTPEELYKQFLEENGLSPDDVSNDMYDLFLSNLKAYQMNTKETYEDKRDNFEQNTGSEPRRNYFENIDDAFENHSGSDVIVFGSNLAGVHGLGAAAKAFSGKWSINYKEVKRGTKGNYAIFGVGEGFQPGNEGMGYALPTKERSFKNTRSKQDIIRSIKKLYTAASKNQDKTFKVLYDISNKNLSGLSSEELAEMFASVSDIPANIIFPKRFSILVESKIDAVNNAENKNVFEDNSSLSLDLFKPIEQHSGGALGADLLFDKLFSRAAKTYGFTFNAFHYHYKKSDSKHKVTDILTKEQLLEGLQKAYQASLNIRGQSTIDNLKKALDTGSGLNDSRISNPARNWFQVKNADAVYAISSIIEPGDVAGTLANGKEYRTSKNVKKPIVSGGTGIAVEMAIQAGKPAYVYNIGQYGSRGIGWYKWDSNRNDFVKLTSAPRLTNKFAGIGSRSVADGKYKSLATKAIVDLVQTNFSSEQNHGENKATKPKQENTTRNIGTKHLKRIGKDIIAFKDGMASKTITSPEELLEIAKEYASILSDKYNFKNDKNYTSLIDDIAKTVFHKDIEFKPVKFSLQREVRDFKNNKLSGQYVVSGNKIIMPFDSDIYSKDNPDLFPAQIILHEYVHAITLDAIEKNDLIRKRIRKIMDIAKKHDIHKDKLNKYAFTDEKEFMAEALTNPNLMQALDNIEVGEQTLLNSAINIFKNILRYFNKTSKNKNTLLGSVMNEFYNIVTDKDAVNEETIEPEGATENNKIELSDKYTLTNGHPVNKEQEKAIDDLVDWYGSDKQIAILSGFAGTGKTSTIETAINEIKKRYGDKSVTYLAYTNKAAAELKRATGSNDTYTIHSALGIGVNDDSNTHMNDNSDSNALHIDPISLGDIIVVDEASMVDDEIYNAILDAADTGSSKPKKIIFMGDKLQLLPVSSDHVSSAITPSENTVFTELNTVMRSRGETPITNIVNKIRNNIEHSKKNPADIITETTRRKNRKQKNGSIYFINPAHHDEIIDHFVRSYKQNPTGTRIITYFNHELKFNPTIESISVHGLNTKIRNKIYPDNPNKYHVGDILMAYNTIKERNDNGIRTLISNSSEYEVIDVANSSSQTFEAEIERAYFGDNKIRLNIPGRIVTLRAVGFDEIVTMFLPDIHTMLRLRDEKAKLQRNRGSDYDLIYSGSNNRSAIDEAKNRINTLRKLSAVFEQIPHVEFTYAITTHKSQGSTYDNVYIFEDSFNIIKDNSEKSRFYYVAISRTSNSVKLISSRNSKDNTDLGSIKVFNGQAEGDVGYLGSTPNTGSTFDLQDNEQYAEDTQIDLGQDQKFAQWFQELLIKDHTGIDPYTGESVLEDGQIVYPNYNSKFMQAQATFMNAFDQALSNLGDKAKITYKEIQTSLDNADNEESAGRIIHKPNGSTEIDVRWNKFKGMSRRSEVVAHEIFHMLTHKVFGNDQHMIDIFDQLRQKAVESGVTHKIFLTLLRNAGVTITQNDIERAKMMFDYVFGDYADPEEFIAYVATNQEVFTAIQDLKIEPEFISYLDKTENDGKITSRFIDFINKMIRVINKVFSAMAKDSRTGSDIVVSSVLKMVELQNQMEEEEQNSSIEEDVPKTKLEEYVDKYDKTMHEMLVKFDTQIDDINRKILQGERLHDTMERLEKVSIIGPILKSHLLQNIAVQLFEKTDNPDVADIYKAFRQGKEFTEKTRTEFSDALKRQLNNLFGSVDKKTRQIITRVIFQTDLPSIKIDGEYVDLRLLKELLTHDDLVEEFISTYTDRLKDTISNDNSLSLSFDSIMEQADGLAEYMVTGKTNIRNQQLNVDNIINRFYFSNSRTQEELYGGISKTKAEAIELLDTIISLKSLKHVSNVDKQIAYDFLSESGSVENILSVMKQYREYIDGIANKIQTTIFRPMKKGYMAEVNNEKMKFEIIPESDLKYYTSIIGNMKNIGLFGIINGVRYYKVIGREHSLGFDEGIFSIASDVTDGISLKTLIINHLLMLEKRKSKVERVDRKTIEDAANNIISSIAIGEAQDIVDFESGHPIPVYDFVGNIIDYKIQLSKDEKINDLEMDDDIIESAAYTFSRMIHRKAAMDNNMKAVDIIMNNVERNVELNPGAYITIKKYDPDVDEEFDEDIHGRWNRLPSYTRNYIFMKTGKYELTIPSNKLELITGEREASAAYVNLGIFKLSNFPRIHNLILAIEDYWKEITAYVRESIAIRMGSVVAQNMVSNIVQSWLEGGISPFEYMKRFRIKWERLDKYRKLNKEYNDLLAKISGSIDDREIKRLQNQLRIVKNRMEKNDFHDLVKDGQFSPIIEDININDTHNGHIATMIENALNKNELTQRLRPIRDTLFMTRNTRLYKSMLKITQYSDVITREILRDEWVKKNKGRYSKEDYEVYLNKLDQMFVNYGYLDNRFLRYAERIGGVFFTKFLFRQMKAIYKIAIEHPARFTGLIGAEVFTGTNVPTADDNYWHFMDAILNRLTMNNPERIAIDAIEPNLFNLLPSMHDIIQVK